MKIFVRFGHETLINGSHTAAVGILKEINVIHEYGAYVAQTLYHAGHTVHTGGDTYKEYATATDALLGDLKKAKDWGADLFVSIHANIGGGVGSGAEVFYKNGDNLSYNIAKSITAAIARDIKIPDRGAKVDSYIETNPSYTTKHAVIIEPFFIDNQYDCYRYDVCGPQVLGEAIGGAILSNL